MVEHTDLLYDPQGNMTRKEQRVSQRFLRMIGCKPTRIGINDSLILCIKNS